MTAFGKKPAVALLGTGVGAILDRMNQRRRGQLRAVSLREHQKRRLPMNRDEIINQLEKLIHLDVDAIHAYDQAIKNIHEQTIKDKMILFQGDHRRHVDLLSAKVIELGGKPPEFTADFKGFIITGFTALRSLTGTKGALEAMETNEKLTTSKYEDAAKLQWPTEIMTIIQTNFADEQRHLSFVREAISTIKAK